MQRTAVSGLLPLSGGSRFVIDRSTEYIPSVQKGWSTVEGPEWRGDGGLRTTTPLPINIVDWDRLERAQW